MWDNGGQMIFAAWTDYEDMILERQEEIEIAEDNGEILDDEYEDLPWE